MLFISSQNPVTSAREIYCLLEAIRLSFDLNVKLIKCTWNFFSQGFSKFRQIYIKFLLSFEEQFIHSALLYSGSYIILLLILFQTSEVIHRFTATMLFRMTQSDIPHFSSFSPNSTKAQDSTFHKQN